MTCTTFLLFFGLLLLPALRPACAQDVLPPAPSATFSEETAEVESLFALPQELTRRGTPSKDEVQDAFRVTPRPFPEVANGGSGIPGLFPSREAFHWKGLLLQSLAFQGLEHGPRVAAADAADRHLLLNKPFWSDYWASLGQYNMRRWNDGDSFVVNYIGHPVQGAISGYIELQNDPQGRDVQFANNSRYWRSRFRAFLWETAYSTEFEIGPISEASIFNQGGYTYPLGCKGHNSACEKTARYTNNTGWVDFVVTPVGGTAMLVAGDMLDRYVSDRLIARHPKRFRYQILRGSLNPPRSLANMLRGRYPWYRDYDDPMHNGMQHRTGSRMRESEPGLGIELHPFVSSVSLPNGARPCRGCRSVAVGPGGEVGVRVGRYFEALSTVRSLGRAGSLNPVTYGGSLLLAHFGLRTGFTGPRFGLGLSLMPGLASYAQTVSAADGLGPAKEQGRSFLFSWQTGVAGDVRVTRRLKLRASLEQIVIRYKSGMRDAPGIGEPPRLSFLSQENYINQTNWGFRVGPVLRF